MIVRLSTHLGTDADTAWQLAQCTSTFIHVTRGMLRWANSTKLPERWQTGAQMRSRMFLFGFIPGWVHELHIVRVDHQHREIQTAEHGGLLRVWNHSIKVEPDNHHRCRYTDAVEIKAGLLTPIVWVIAHIFFRYRQMRLRSYCLRSFVRSAHQVKRN
jgi:hypothetical protein